MLSIRRFFVSFCLVLGFALSLGVLGNSYGQEKNIIFFITDDQSPDGGCYGNKVLKTPNLDYLASEGVIFTDAYATTASCSASRSVVLSGIHNHANGQYGHQHGYHKFASWPNLISLTLPRVLGQHGYRTIHIGKYHVAPEEVYRFDTYLKENSREPVAMANQVEPFIKEKSDKPFFLYFATSDPHRGGGIDETDPTKPDLFGNLPKKGQRKGVEEVFYTPEEVIVPPFLPDTAETRGELVQYYQSVSRIDQGLGRLIEILKEAGKWENTLIVFTSDHGMAFSGGKTTTYEPGLRVPFVVRNPYAKARGTKNLALVSHVDITPSLVDFAGALNQKHNVPKGKIDANKYWEEQNKMHRENKQFKPLVRYHGRSWIPIMDEAQPEGWDSIYASHTFHEIQMYYPMRVVRDREYKLIWNIAHGLPYPFASDLWKASSWQAQWKKGKDAPYGTKTVGEYVNRPQFELYDMKSDPDEDNNLAGDERYREVLEKYQSKIKDFQTKYNDPWVMKWDYE